MSFDVEKFVYWLLGTGTVIGAGFIGMIRRIDTKASRHEMEKRFAEHRDETHKNLERRDSRLREEMGEILRRLDRQDAATDVSRQRVDEKLDRIGKDIAVLKDRARIRPE